MEILSYFPSYLPASPLATAAPQSDILTTVPEDHQVPAAWPGVPHLCYQKHCIKINNESAK